MHGFPERAALCRPFLIHCTSKPHSTFLLSKTFFPPLVAAVITAFVIPWLKGKIDADKLEKIELWVTVAVEAAEQLYVGSGRGAEKKAYVVQFLQEKGFTIDPDSLDKLIEAAVFNLPEYIGLIEAEGEEND